MPLPANPWAPGGARYAPSLPRPAAPLSGGSPGASPPDNPWAARYAGEYLAEYGPSVVETGDEAYLPDFSRANYASGEVPNYARRAVNIREAYGAAGLQYVPTEEQMLTQQLITLAVIAISVAAPHIIAALSAKGGAASAAAAGGGNATAAGSATVSAGGATAGGASGASGGFFTKLGQLAGKIFNGKGAVLPKFRKLGYGLSKSPGLVSRTLSAVGQGVAKLGAAHAVGEASLPRVNERQIRTQARQLRQEHARTRGPQAAPEAPVVDPVPYVQEFSNQVLRGELTWDEFNQRLNEPSLLAVAGDAAGVVRSIGDHLAKQLRDRPFIIRSSPAPEPPASRLKDGFNSSNPWAVSADTFPDLLPYSDRFVALRDATRTNYSYEQDKNIFPNTQHIIEFKQLDRLKKAALAALEQPVIVKVAEPLELTEYFNPFRPGGISSRKYFLDSQQQKEYESFFGSPEPGSVYYIISADGTIDLNKPERIPFQAQAAPVSRLVMALRAARYAQTLVKARPGLLKDPELIRLVRNGQVIRLSAKIGSGTPSSALAQEASTGALTPTTRGLRGVSSHLEKTAKFRDDLLKIYNTRPLTAFEQRYAFNLYNEATEALRLAFSNGTKFPFGQVHPQSVQEVVKIMGRIPKITQ